MQKYYIADPHFGHEAIIKFCQRPFQTVEEMNRVMIDNWNNLVSAEDEVYIIGDFMYRSKHHPEYYLDQLKGKKHLILGNHDRWTNQVDLPLYFESVTQVKEIEDQSRHIVLCHYPMVEWPRYHKGSIHIFGHIHNSKNAAYDYYRNQDNMFNAGVEINHFKPVTLQHLITNNLSFKMGEIN
ncbi:hydrolase [Bacillus sp. UMB0899]|nr:hydrolase [Bacillus sp. UMB0899]